MQGRGALPSIPRGPKAQCASHGCDTLADGYKSPEVEGGKSAVRPFAGGHSLAATILVRRPNSGKDCSSNSSLSHPSQMYNCLFAGSSPASSTTQSCANLVSCGLRKNPLHSATFAWAGAKYGWKAGFSGGSSPLGHQTAPDCHAPGRLSWSGQEIRRRTRR